MISFYTSHDKTKALTDPGHYHRDANTVFKSYYSALPLPASVWIEVRALDSATKNCKGTSVSGTIFMSNVYCRTSEMGRTWCNAARLSSTEVIRMRLSFMHQSTESVKCTCHLAPGGLCNVKSTLCMTRTYIFDW